MAQEPLHDEVSLCKGMKKLLETALENEGYLMELGYIASAPNTKGGYRRIYAKLLHTNGDVIKKSTQALQSCRRWVPHILPKELEERARSHFPGRLRD